MKNLFRILSVISLTLLVAGLQSCEKKNPAAEETGSLELFLSLDDQAISNLKSDLPDSMDIRQFHALLTVIGPDSMPVLEDELLPLYKFGEGFFSEKIELKTGHYRLVKFMIIDPSGEVIFASPMRGSPKAYLVKDPLPIFFNVKPDENTRLRPEVLPVQGDPPSEFGYSQFGFSVVKPLTFYAIAMLNDPRIMAPTQITEAKLTVWHPDGWHHSFDLKAMVNRLVIRGGEQYYSLVAEKEGYDPVKMQVTARELIATSKENPLHINFGPNVSHILRLQPDPEMGMDAMISNLDPEENFGKHPYFEATWMTDDSPLAVMRENRSLIKFSPTGLPKSAIIQKVTLTLFYDFPLPWDGTVIMDTLIDASGNVVLCAGVLQQIIEPWDEHEVSWENQPKTNEKVQVYIRPFIKNANFINVDVTRMWLNEFSFPSYGMLFKLSPEPCFAGFRFASSDHEKPELRPMLTIHYTLPIY